MSSLASFISFDPAADGPAQTQWLWHGLDRVHRHGANRVDAELVEVGANGGVYYAPPFGARRNAPETGSANRARPLAARCSRSR